MGGQVESRINTVHQKRKPRNFFSNFFLLMFFVLFLIIFGNL